jgi:hypothetical protein
LLHNQILALIVFFVVFLLLDDNPIRVFKLDVSFYVKVGRFGFDLSYEFAL